MLQECSGICLVFPLFYLFSLSTSSPYLSQHVTQQDVFLLYGQVCIHSWWQTSNLGAYVSSDPSVPLTRQLGSFIFQSSSLTHNSLFHAWLLMKSCERFEWSSNTTCSGWSAIYLISDAAGKEWDLIETAIIMVVSLPVNLLSSMMSFSSWRQIDCSVPGAQTRAHANTHTDNYFWNMTGLYEGMDFGCIFLLHWWMAPGNKSWNEDSRETWFEKCLADVKEKAGVCRSLFDDWLATVVLLGREADALWRLWGSKMTEDGWKHLNVLLCICFLKLAHFLDMFGEGIRS